MLQRRRPDGGEVLRTIRADRELAGLPVVALAPPAWRAALLAAGCAEVLERAPAEGLIDGAVRRALAASDDAHPPPPLAARAGLSGEEAGD